MAESQLLPSLLGPILAAMPRIGAAVTVAPLFPGSVFPAMVRATIVVSLSLHLYPYMAAHMPAGMPPFLWMALIGKEVFIGSLLGLAVGTLIWAFESVGAMIDFQVGFSNARVFDPFGGNETGPLAHLMTRLAITLFIVGGGLQVLASLLFESFRLWPLLSFYPSTDRLAGFAGESVESFGELVVKLAAPAVLLLAVVDLGFGLVGRVVTQLNVFFFTMPIKAALAALMLAVYVSYLSDVLAGRINGLESWLKHLDPVLQAR
jgi:type III secretion protein T